MVDPKNKPSNSDEEPTIASDEVSSPFEEYGRYLASLDNGLVSADPDKHTQDDLRARTNPCDLSQD